MDQRGAMMRKVAGEADVNDRKYPQHHLMAPHIQPVPQSQMNITFPKKLALHKLDIKDKTGLETASQKEDDAFYYSGANNMAHLLHSASGDLIECMSEESLNMKPGTLSHFMTNIKTFEQNNLILEDVSLEESEFMVPEEVSSFDEDTVSINNAPWAFSEGSEVMELESPSALESMASTLILHDHKLVGSSMEFGFTPHRKMKSLNADELKNQVKESSNRFRSRNQETVHKSVTSGMASSSKDTSNMKPKEQKQFHSLEVERKQNRDNPILRSSLPVKTSLLGRVKANKKVDAVLEASITNEKLLTLDRSVKSVKPKQADVMCDKRPRASLSTLSPPKSTHLSPKLSLVLKNKSSSVKSRSRLLDSGRNTGQIIPESSKITGNAGMSKVGDTNILKQFTESQTLESAVNYAPELNNRKLRLVKNQAEVGNLDEVRETALHVIEQKPIGVAQNSTEQKHMEMRSQRSSRTMSSRSSVSSSAFLSSSCEEGSDGSRLTIRKASGYIGEKKGRTPLHVAEQKLVGVAALKSAEQKHTKIRSQQSSRSFSSRYSIASSSLVSPCYEEENDVSRFTIRDASRLKKTHIGERKGRTPLHLVKQKLIGATLMSTKQKHKKLSSQLSSRASSSRSSISSSAFVPSSFEEENDECQSIASNDSGSKKTQIGELMGRKPFHSQKIDNKKIQKLVENISLEGNSLSLDEMPFRWWKEVSPHREIPGQRKSRLLQEKAVPQDENFEGETGKSSFRENSESITACSSIASPVSPMIELRHQDVQEKNAQALFNDRIEENAIKLVKARNSKVKALVSAFESIISLQERTI